jgi:uncharacterized protein
VALWLGGEPIPLAEDEPKALLRRKGLEHEAAVLRHLEEVHGEKSVRIPTQGLSLTDRVLRTACAITECAPIIYQPALLSDDWVGFPDFLIRISNGDGQWAYRPDDAKLSRKATRDHVLQIGVYAELLNRSFGYPVAEGIIHCI